MTSAAINEKRGVFLFRGDSADIAQGIPIDAIVTEIFACARRRIEDTLGEPLEDIPTDEAKRRIQNRKRPREGEGVLREGEAGRDQAGVHGPRAGRVQGQGPGARLSPRGVSGIVAKHGEVAARMVQTESEWIYRTGEKFKVRSVRRDAESRTVEIELEEVSP